MASYTYKERLTAGLVAIGWVLDRNDRSKYDAYVKVSGGSQKLFVGPSGALRSGECASRSYSVGCPGMEGGFYTKLLQRGDTALAQVRLAPVSTCATVGA